ncbi:MAG: endonuclease, partial [Candidatus Aenigmarchaeota archaeon]|nr:endonuclease [Candidatus Aenigmarchaeota archaeon]
MIYNSNSPKTIFKILFEKYSDKVESWWPTTVKDKKNIDFEIIVGVILTQNTNWNNVVKSLNNLNKRNMINIEAIKNSPINEIQELIKPSGFFRQKAVYLKNIC